MPVKNLLRKVRKTNKKLYKFRLEASASDIKKYEQYKDDPNGFANKVLGVQLVPKAAEIIESLGQPPYRTLVPSCNAYGKTFLAAVTVLWWFCTRSPCMILTTAPSMKQVKDNLWKEIRRLARNARLKIPFLPKACRIERNSNGSDDLAFGVTAKDDTGLQGKHGPNQLFIIDEATGVAPLIWEAILSMWRPPGHAWLAILNPTNTNNQAYFEYTQAGRNRSWKVIRLDAREHPNILAGLQGEEPPVPDAVRLEQFETQLIGYSQLVGGTPLASDVQWPPEWATDYIARTGKKPQWYRPGPLAEARLLGRYPTQGICSVWSDGDWIAATRVGLDPLKFKVGEIPELGVDVAREGDDNTALHSRCGWISLAHEETNGLRGNEVIGAVIQSCRFLAYWFNSAEWNQQPFRRGDFRPIDEFQIPIKIDSTGMGGTLGDMLRSMGYRAVDIDASTLPNDPKNYPRRRHELWFSVVMMARMNLLDLSRLDEEDLEQLRIQAMAPTYELDHLARRKVCDKKITKKLIGRSPDGMDALNLAYAETFTDEIPEIAFERGNPLGVER